MIDRYTIKFGPAVSQKELEKALHGRSVSPEEYATKLNLTKFKARIEFVGDFEDLKLLRGLLNERSSTPDS